ncbi:MULTISPECIES: hypothetical protein [Erwinia]|uniref:Uncharacterized protein n=1 Tax=Erwinia plantamica TaxID=3237104 RepID=A0ABW7CHZ9_9GAMM|nr:hypothetical protein [Erwinia sp. BC051422]MDN8540262.1 hypothetical protein [Erwinia sp. BC051422]
MALNGKGCFASALKYLQAKPSFMITPVETPELSVTTQEELWGGRLPAARFFNNIGKAETPEGALISKSLPNLPSD